MPALETVGQYLSQARVLLQDTVEPYRYKTSELVDGLNMGILEARRLRADLFLPAFTIPWTDPATADPTALNVPWEPQYRPALVYYMVGYAQLRDDEATADARATGFLSKFTSQLLYTVPPR